MPALLQRPIRLTVEEYRTAFGATGLSTMHWNLAPPGTAELRPAESVAIRDRALTGLRRLGLLNGTGIHPDLADALGLIAHAETQISARIATPGDASTGMVAAARGGYAVLATLTTEALDLEPVRPDDLVNRAGHRITRVGPVPGGPVTLPAELLAPGKESTPEQLDRRLASGGVPRREVQALHTLIGGSKRAAASIEVARDFGTGHRTAGVSLTHVETDRGGVAFHYHRRDRQLLCTVTPCDAAGLSRLIAELLAVC